jgi:predicted dehydrogenase
LLDSRVAASLSAPGSSEGKGSVLKAVLVGCGKIADAHIEEIRKVPGAHVAAVCDLEPLMAEQLAVRYSIPKRYSNVAEMLEAEKPDVVHISTPPQSHLPLTRQAVAAGCHVFLEKPVALHHAEVKAIVDVVEASGKKLAVNYWPQFEVQALELRRLYNDGVLGEVVHVESHIGYNLAGEFGAAIQQDANHWVRRMPGQLFQNVLDHVLNKVAPFIDDDQPEIDAFAYQSQVSATGSGISGILDELRVVIRGTRTSAYATFSSNARPVGQTLRVYGTRNTAHVDYNARTVVLERNQSFPSALGRLFPPFLVARDYRKQGLKNLGRFRRSRFHFFDGMRTLLTEFYRSIETGSPPPISYRDILFVSSTMERIFNQVYQGQSA